MFKIINFALRDKCQTRSTVCLETLKFIVRTEIYYASMHDVYCIMYITLLLHSPVQTANIVIK